MHVLWFRNLYARQRLYRYRNFKRMRWGGMQMEVLTFSSCILAYCLVHSDWRASPSRSLLVKLHAAQVRGCVGTWGQSRDGISRNWILCTFAFNSRNLHGWPWIAGGFKIQRVNVFHDGVLSREVDVDHTTLHCFSWKFLSLVILFLLSHAMMKNNRLLSKKGSILLNTLSGKTIFFFFFFFFC